MTHLKQDLAWHAVKHSKWVVIIKIKLILLGKRVV